VILPIAKKLTSSKKIFHLPACSLSVWDGDGGGGGVEEEEDDDARLQCFGQDGRSQTGQNDISALSHAQPKTQSFPGIHTHTALGARRQQSLFPKLVSRARL